MSILNIAGYKFTALTNIEAMQKKLLAQCEMHNLRGTILLSKEGININLAGCLPSIASFKEYLQFDEQLSDITFRESYSLKTPFKRLKIKLKNEIITLRRPEVDSLKFRASTISPELFKQWLDEKRDITILDVRNDYEIKFGTFKNAINLHLNNFNEFPSSINQVAKNKPVVMFCTGGIRCEKAALYMLQESFPEIYQLEGGILNYFAQIGGDHYQGECFVFDNRISVNPNLEETKTLQCTICQGPIPEEQPLINTASRTQCSSCST